MEELIEILIPEVELTITVTRERGALLLPKKLSDEMNLIEGDKLIPLKNAYGDVYIRRATDKDITGIRCHRRHANDNRLSVYSVTLTNMLLEPDEHRGLFLVDKKKYKDTDVYYICTKNNLYGRTTRYQNKGNNPASKR